MGAMNVERDRLADVVSALKAALKMFSGVDENV
jgi:hypothetical protein